MPKSNLKDFLLYGGISKEEYDKAAPLIATANLKTWRISSIFFEIILVLLFVVILVGYSVNGSGTITGETFRPLILPVGILTGYMMLFVLVSLLILDYKSKSLMF